MARPGYQEFGTSVLKAKSTKLDAKRCPNVKGKEMSINQVIAQIKHAIEDAPRNAYVAELHLQVIKHADVLQSVTEREIMAWTGHNSPTMVQVYAGKALRGLLADHGFEKLIKNEKGSELDEPNKKGSTK